MHEVLGHSCVQWWDAVHNFMGCSCINLLCAHAWTDQAPILHAIAPAVSTQPLHTGWALCLLLAGNTWTFNHTSLPPVLAGQQAQNRIFCRNWPRTNPNPNKLLARRWQLCDRLSKNSFYFLYPRELTTRCCKRWCCSRLPMDTEHIFAARAVRELVMRSMGLMVCWPGFYSPLNELSACAETLETWTLVSPDSQELHGSLFGKAVGVWGWELLIFQWKYLCPHKNTLSHQYSHSSGQWCCVELELQEAGADFK